MATSALSSVGFSSSRVRISRDKTSCATCTLTRQTHSSEGLVTIFLFYIYNKVINSFI